MLQSQTAINPSVQATVHRTLLNAFKHTMHSELLPLGKQNKLNPRQKGVKTCTYIYVYIQVVMR